MSTFGNRLSGRRLVPGADASRRGYRNRDRESASVPRTAVHLNSATMRLQNVFCQSKTKPAAFGVMYQPVAYAVELLEYAFLFRLRDPDSPVFNLDRNLFAALRDANAQFLSIRGVFHPIVNQIQERLGYGFGVDQRRREMTLD